MRTYDRLVPVGTYGRLVSRRRRSRLNVPTLPRSSGRALAEAIAFSPHALERFAERGPREIKQRDELALRVLIAHAGVVLTRPPSWFHGPVADDTVLVGISKRFVVPVVPAAIRDGALPARRWHATTFISRGLGADLRTLSGEDLSALTMIPRRVVAAWVAADPGRAVGAHAALRDELRRISAASAAVAFIAGSDELQVALPGGTLVLVRAGRNEGHGARLRAVAWRPDALADQDR
jgi:hypothetical protein